MNYRMIAYLMGYIILIEAAFMILPLLVALIYLTLVVLLTRLLARVERKLAKSDKS